MAHARFRRTERAATYEIAQQQHAIATRRVDLRGVEQRTQLAPACMHVANYNQSSMINV